MTDTHIRGPWALFADTHYNSRAFVVARGGLTYRTKEGPSFTAGYAHLWTDAGGGGFGRDEHRPWAQAFLPFGFADDWTLSQRFRTELRIQERTHLGETTDGFISTPRLRSQSAVSYWFAESGPMRFFVQGAVELLVSGGKNAGPNFLDQSRYSVMVGQRRAGTTVRLGYMTRFVPTNSGLQPVLEHNAVFWVSFKTKGPIHAPVQVPEGGNP